MFLLSNKYKYIIWLKQIKKRVFAAIEAEQV